MFYKIKPMNIQTYVLKPIIFPFHFMSIWSKWQKETCVLFKWYIGLQWFFLLVDCNFHFNRSLTTMILTILTQWMLTILYQLNNNHSAIKIYWVNCLYNKRNIQYWFQIRVRDGLDSSNTFLFLTSVIYKHIYTILVW